LVLLLASGCPGTGGEFSDLIDREDSQIRKLCRKGSRAKLKYAETCYRH
jgi:hypothetical protein